jgi:hypothetical protein
MTLHLFFYGRSAPFFCAKAPLSPGIRDDRAQTSTWGPSLFFRHLARYLSGIGGPPSSWAAARLPFESIDERKPHHPINKHSTAWRYHQESYTYLCRIYCPKFYDVNFCINRVVHCYIRLGDFFLLWRNGRYWARASSLLRLHDHTHSHHSR